MISGVGTLAMWTQSGKTVYPLSLLATSLIVCMRMLYYECTH